MKASKLNIISFYTQLVVTALLVALGEGLLAVFSGVVTFQYFKLARLCEIVEGFCAGNENKGDE